VRQVAHWGHPCEARKALKEYRQIVCEMTVTESDIGHFVRVYKVKPMRLIWTNSPANDSSSVTAASLCETKYDWRFVINVVFSLP
jgi:hypothetical protein